MPPPPPPPEPDAGVGLPPDGGTDAGGCGDPTFDADGGVIPARCDGGVVTADAAVDGTVSTSPDAASADARPSDEPHARDAALPPGQRAQALSEGEPVCPGIDLAPPRVLYMSADDSNSMAAPVIVRRLVRSGSADIPSHLIRPWEFLNDYRFSFDRPEPGELSVSAKLGSCDLTQDFALQIAVQSQAASDEDRAPMHFVLVLDTSGSMEGEPMRLQQAAVRALAGSLRAGDRVSAVTWAEEQRPLIAGRVVEGAGDPAVLDLVDGMQAAGGTNL